MMKRVMTACCAALTLISAAPALAQTQDTAAAHAPRQTIQQAMAKLDFMHGVWVGPASGTNPDRSTFAITQTERIGPLLGGDVLVIEGRGYRDDGSTGFNAFAVLSWNTEEQKYELRSYAQGRSGTFPFTLRDNGYQWEVPAGPGKVVYTATITGDHFREVGVFSMPGIPEQPMFEMNLTRRSDTDWPAAGAITP